MRKFLLIALLACSMSFAQNQVGLQITQDVKLGVIGDKEHGYDAGTLDVSIKVMLEGTQSDYGYLIVYPEFEYAELKYFPYRRWTANVGYIFNGFLDNGNLESGAALGYGFIDRGLSDFSWGATGFLNYKISDTFKIVGNLQLAERSDLEILYGDRNQWRLSGFLGIQIKLMNPISRRWNKTPGPYKNRFKKETEDEF